MVVLLKIQLKRVMNLAVSDSYFYLWTKYSKIRYYRYNKKVFIVREDWYIKSEEEVLRSFRSNESGHSDEDAKARLREYGRNVLPKGKRKTIFHIFFSKFLSPITLILIAAAIFSLIVGEMIDSIFIGIVILLDAVLGTFQEWKAEETANSLQKIIKETAIVLRNKEAVEISTEELVIGDIILLDSGDKVPADARLIHSTNLLVNQAFLTGESTAIHKNHEKMNSKKSISEMNNIVFAGSLVTTGRGTAVVVATGGDTEIGKIAQNVLATKSTKSPLTIRMDKFVKQISIMVGILAIVLVFILYIKGFAPKEIFFSVVALSISVVAITSGVGSPSNVLLLKLLFIIFFKPSILIILSRDRLICVSFNKPNFVAQCNINSKISAGL